MGCLYTDLAQFYISGCPEPVSNHAKNCVEMGLGMITAIRQFDEDRDESVNMRVRLYDMLFRQILNLL